MQVVITMQQHNTLNHTKGKLNIKIKGISMVEQLGKLRHKS
jgi:hypothetical protein